MKPVARASASVPAAENGAGLCTSALSARQPLVRLIFRKLFQGGLRLASPGLAERHRSCVPLINVRPNMRWSRSAHSKSDNREREMARFRMPLYEIRSHRHKHGRAGYRLAL